MTQETTTARLARTSGPPAGAGRGVWALLKRWQARASDRAHLARLDDRMLRDMGLTRAQARREIAKPFWRP